MTTLDYIWLSYLTSILAFTILGILRIIDKYTADFLYKNKEIKPTNNITSIVILSYLISILWSIWYYHIIGKL